MCANRIEQQTQEKEFKEADVSKENKLDPRWSWPADRSRRAAMLHLWFGNIVVMCIRVRLIWCKMEPLMLLFVIVLVVAAVLIILACTWHARAHVHTQSSTAMHFRRDRLFGLICRFQKLCTGLSAHKLITWNFNKCTLFVTVTL